MYFSAFHAIAVFVTSTLAIAGFGWIIYSFCSFKDRLKAKAALKQPPEASGETFSKAQMYALKTAKKQLLAFSIIILASYVIISIGTLMALDSWLKSCYLKDFKYVDIGDQVRLSANIYNNGKVALASCTLKARIINTTPKNVDGSIFAPRWFDANKLERKRSSYEYSFDFDKLIEPRRYLSVNVSIPKVFMQYKVRAYVNCD